jgi:hypothetical protein
MKKLGAIEKSALVLAAVFIAFGVYSIIHPTEMFVSAPTSGWPPKSVIGPDPPRAHVSPLGARIYGLISVGVGTGVGWLVFYRPRK